MGRLSGLAQSGIFDPANGTLVLPLWSAAVMAALFVALCLFVLGRPGRDGTLETVSRTGLLLAGAALAWVVLDATAAGTFATQRRALDARLLEMTTRAVMPGSPLACLDNAAGDLVEEACEKALFATPEAAAASVAYVTAQLSLLAEGSEFERRSGADYESALMGLRHALETDRFGIVAHVLADRDGCSPDRCGSFGLLRDTSQVSDNLSTHRYETFVLHHASDWLQGTLTTLAADSSVPAHAPQPNPAAQASAPAGSVPAKPAPNGLYFPSSASIPAVSIMNAEPAPAPAAAAAADATAKPPAATGRKPAPQTQQSHRPINLAAPARSAAPAPGQVGDE